MTATGHDSLHTRRTLTVEGRDYAYYALPEAAARIGDIARLPFSMKVLLENLLRFEDGDTVTPDDFAAMAAWLHGPVEREIQYRPARVLMQDFTGVPAVVDLAAMRDAMAKLGGDPQKPAGAVRSGDRPLGDGGRIRQRECLQGQCGPRIPPQYRAL